MFLVKTILILFLLLVVFFVFRQYNIKVEEFINHLPISNTIKCFNDNENLQLFCDDMNIIFDKYKIETGEFEISTKFTKNDINANRLVAFIPSEYIKKNNNLLDECFTLNKIPNSVQNKIIQLMNKTIKSKSQVLFGIDLNEKTRRVYLNYDYKDKIHLVGFSIEKDSIAQKIYKEMKLNDFKSNLKNFIGNKIFNILLKTFPSDTWKMMGTKEDEKITQMKYSSYYINILFEYKVNYFGKNLINLLQQFCNNKKALEKWFECFKDNNITWLSFGRDRDNRLFITIYCVHGRDIRNSIDIKQIKEFNDSLTIIKQMIGK
jgi:hypothetical protein